MALDLLRVNRISALNFHQHPWVVARIDNTVIPIVQGMCLLNEAGKAVLEPLVGITTATGVFDEISIKVVRPKPRIIQKEILKLL